MPAHEVREHISFTYQKITWTFDTRISTMSLEVSSNDQTLDVQSSLQMQTGESAEHYLDVALNDATIVSISPSGSGVFGTDGLLAGLTDSVEPDPPPSIPLHDDFLI